MKGKPRSTLYDRLLLPRIEQYGQNNDAGDLDAVVDYLRRNYKEYARHKLGPFRQQVARAIEAVLQRPQEGKPELRLPAWEDRHRSQSGDDDGDDRPGGSSSSDGLDADVAAGIHTGGGGMNQSLSSLYGAGAGEPPAAPSAMEAVDAGAAAPAAGGGTPSAGAAAMAADGDAGEAPAPAPRPKRGAAPAPGGSKRARTAGRGGGGGYGGGFGPAPSARAPPAPVRYADLGGIEPVLGALRELVELPLRHPEVYAWLGVPPPRGVLLHGPPGCGKTALANAVANELGVPFFRVSAPELVAGVSGESEAKVRALFAEAAAAAPAIVFIDEIDAIAPKREAAAREMERRIVAQLLTCLDGLGGGGGGGGAGGDGEADADAALEGGLGSPPAPPAWPAGHVVVLGATNRPDALDPALRRAGRFDREVALGVPSEAARAAIVAVLARGLRLDGGLDCAAVARRTPGFVGADLSALVKEAAAEAVRRTFDALDARDAAAGGAPASAPPPHRRRGPLSPAELAGLAVTAADFAAALGKVQPSVRREGFSTAPDVSWDDVGALEDVREELAFAVTLPIARPAAFAALGLSPGAGVLLYGPPGCGKTLVAKAAAAESRANFVSIKGPELLNKYVGESERAVRALFARARAAAPCVLFFDELDALAPRRGADGGGAGAGGGSSSGAAERVVNQLLAEMDGAEGRGGVYLLAATNRPDMIDPALLRPGRLDRLVYVPLPPAGARPAILAALARRTPLAADVDLAAIGAWPALDGFSGADLAALVREACVAALKEGLAAAGEAGGARGGGSGAAAAEGEGLAGGAAEPAAPAAEVAARHFAAAAARVLPSVSRRDQRRYEALRTRLRAARGQLGGGDADGGDGGGAAPAAGGGEPMDEAV